MVAGILRQFLRSTKTYYWFQIGFPVTFVVRVTGRCVFSLVSVGCMRVLVRRGRSTISMWHASRHAARDRSVRRVGDSAQLGTRCGWLGSEQISLPTRLGAQAYWHGINIYTCSTTVKSGHNYDTTVSTPHSRTPRALHTVRSPKILGKAVLPDDLVV